MTRINPSALRKYFGILLVLFLAVIFAACSPDAPPSTPLESEAQADQPTAPADGAGQATESSVPTEVAESTPTEAAHEPAPAPAPPVYPIHGIEMAFMGKPTVELVAQAGAYWTRRNALLWSEIEPQEGARNWDAVQKLEKELTNAADQGLEVILIVRSTPEWAQAVTGQKCGPVTSDKLPAFAAFMQDVVERYSAPPYNVKYWEIWNEPDIGSTDVPSDNIFGCWGDANSPYYGGEYYGEMLKAVYPQVKAMDPDAQLLVGGLLLFCDPINPPETEPGAGTTKNCTPARFLEGILEGGGGDYFDGISFHAYDYYYEKSGGYGNTDWHSSWNSTGPVLIAKTRYVRGILAAYGQPDKFLVNSEAGILCGSDGKEPKCQAEQFHLAKAYYAVQTNVSALAEGLQANIWYSLTGWKGSGLVDSDRQPYLAYDAYAFSASQLQDAAFVREVNQYPGVKGYELSRNGRVVWVLWSFDGDEHGLQLPALPAAIYDPFGASLDPAQEFTVKRAPVYIEFAP